MSTDKLYLVTKEANRHEDHIPFGVFTWEGVKKHFPNVENPDHFKPNEWYEFQALYHYYVKKHPEFYDEHGGIDKICSSEEEFYNFCDKFSSPNWDSEFRTYRIIQIVVNEEMDFT